MDSKRFDNWTRNRALRLSRRDALRVMGVGGAAAALPAVLPEAAIAQSTCSLTIHAETAGGPSAPTTYDGTLQITLASDGSFSQATFTPSSGGGAQSATGQATGRAIDIEIALPGNQTLALSGAGAQPIERCTGDVAGILSGPQPGDLGAWQATATGGASGGSTSSGSSTSGAGSSGSTGPSSGNCPAPQIACGQNCCPGGATCTDQNQGLCACPSGTEQCGTNCVKSCSDGQSLDLDTCTCPGPEAACIQNQQTCQNHGQCCSGYCGGGTCFDCSGKVCGDFGCIDPSKDSQNCGNCGNVCVYPKVCSGGVCGCAPDQTPCIDHSECCSQLCFAGSVCTTCSDVTAGDGTPLTFCAAGSCVDLRTDIDNCGACGKVCPRTSGGIVCEAGVCHDINNDADFCGFGHVTCPAGQICHFGDCVNP
jgi:hypothetical protein